MKVIVDTPIWSYALRSKKKGYEACVKELETLISDQRVVMLGPIRQEVLSGYSVKSKFEKLNSKLRYFENEQIIDGDYVQAATFSNTCRSKGVQGSHVDFLICAVAFRLKSEIFTTDKDFSHYKKYTPIQLFNI
ncbi:MAG: PIN domain-containing protein [Gammaproteobacteria bacterium]|nr:PIN domain-containing protein [Gammaproteobacteria bacterium]MCF6259649.1 PIN domain-containing protein [Gammaproteobacteria bacterium]